ncbi:MAG: phenylalanine--tRNA ligase subunit beta [Nanoarchaeota archaeon]|nr:phenylalanine--tRNA ligase subunit beta [Nanoarchaeota archaeon]
MPTVTINRKVLDRIIGKKLPDDKLKDRISMLGTDLERMDDSEIVVEIFPNRPDMLSEQGFGRAMCSFLGVQTGLRKYDVKKSGEKVIVTKEVKDVRPFTVCAIARNLKLDDEKIREIIQVQEKLHITFCRKRKKAAIGIYPLEKIKMPITFTAKKPEDIKFRPLEANREMAANEILEQHPTGKEYAHLVKGLKKYAVFQDANSEILSFTPIINSHKTGKVTDATKEVFIEVSGPSLHTNEYVLNILTCALADMGAQIYSMEVVYPDKTITTPNLSPREVDYSLDFLNKTLGISLNHKEFKENMEKMGFGVEKDKVLVPCYRPDIIHQVDLAEDLAIAYGYETFIPELPKKATPGEEDAIEKFRKKVSILLAGLNMLETSSYHISNKDLQLKKMLLKEKDYVELANSKSEDYTLMRYSMLASLMQILGENTHNEYPQDLYEMGYIFRQDDAEETGVREDLVLSIVKCGPDAEYTKIRQVLDYLFTSLDMKYEVKEASHPSYMEGRCAKIIVGGKDIGYLGELNPQVLENFGVSMPAAGMEIKFWVIYK